MTGGTIRSPRPPGTASKARRLLHYCDVVVTGVNFGFDDLEPYRGPIDAILSFIGRKEFARRMTYIAGRLGRI